MKKVISFVLLIATLLSTFSVLFITSSAATNGHTQKEAISWLEERIGKKIGNGECPALAKAYYEYLGYGDVSGSGKDYEFNVPDGWTRYYYSAGFVPQPGDVAVWRKTETTGGQKSGHVAIVASATSTGMVVYEQGKSAGYKVRKNTYSKYGSVTCFIRPGPGFAGIQVNGFTVSFPYPEIAELNYHIENTDNCYSITEHRLYYKKSGDSSWKYKKKTYSTPKTKSINIKATLGKPTNLSENTAYDVKIKVYANGKTYTSETFHFTTPAKTNISSATVTVTNMKYNGEYQYVVPNIKVNVNGTELTYGKDYRLSETDIRDIGVYTISINGQGFYKGSVKTKIKVYPKTPTLKKVSYISSSKKLKIEWARVADCSKQQIQISTSPNFEKSKTYTFSVDSEKQSVTVKTLKFNGTSTSVKKGQKYYVRMRAYKTVNGENIYGKWGNAKSYTVPK